MKLKYALAILNLFLFLSMGLTGCRKEAESVQKDGFPAGVPEEQKLQIAYDNETDLDELEELEYSGLIENLSIPYCLRSMLSVVYDIEELREEEIAGIVRYHHGKFYSAARIEGGSYLFLLYLGTDIDQNFLVDGFLVSGFADKTFFEGISKGMKQEEIIKKDPSACIALDGEYSYHRFSDRSVLQIKYTLEDKQYVVSEFEFLQDQLSVVDYLLPQDLEKILP